MLNIKPFIFNKTELDKKMNIKDEIQHYIEDLAGEYACYTKDGYVIDLENVKTTDRQKLISLLIKQDNFDIEALGDSCNNETAAHLLLTALRTNKETDFHNFMTKFLEDLESHYWNRMQQEIDYFLRDWEGFTGQSLYRDIM